MLVVLALLLAAPVATNAPFAGVTPVALMPLRALGVPAEVAKALETTLRNELSALPEARLLSEERVREALRDAAPECAAEISCAARAALKAGAERMIAVTASQLGDSFLIDLKLLDARSEKEIRRATRPVNGSQDGLIETLREAAVELLAPTRFVGALQIEVPGVSDAIVFIDGKPAGTAPFRRPIENVAPGSHTVRVADARSREVSTFVEVKYGRTTQARIELGPERMVRAAYEGKAWLRPAAYTGLGLAAASLLTGLAFHSRAYGTAAELNRREASAQLLPSDAAAYQSVDRDTARARAFYVAAAVLGAAGGFALYWDFRLAAGPTQVTVGKSF